MKATYEKYRLQFRETAITSRASMTYKDTYIIRLEDEDGRVGVGEAGLFAGLSSDDVPGYEDRLSEALLNPTAPGDLNDFPSIRIGLEMALANLRHGGNLYFPSAFTGGETEIKINGLIWMGTREKMLERIGQKLDAGFRCIKIKIGGIDFEYELSLLRFIRKRFPADELELRLDANGSFTPENALDRLHQLSHYHIHSIEQPIKAGKWTEMSRIVQESPIRIALDEELIGVNDSRAKEQLLDEIRPDYIILKPTLHGGFSGAEEWTKLARRRGISWWITSALESNIGLNAIAQWTALFNPAMPQGLGTGGLYTNNFPSPLHQERDYLRFNV